MYFTLLSIFYLVWLSLNTILELANFIIIMSVFRQAFGLKPMIVLQDLFINSTSETTMTELNKVSSPSNYQFAPQLRLQQSRVQQAQQYQQSQKLQRAQQTQKNTFFFSNYQGWQQDQVEVSIIRRTLIQQFQQQLDRQTNCQVLLINDYSSNRRIFIDLYLKFLQAAYSEKVNPVEKNPQMFVFYNSLKSEEDAEKGKAKKGPQQEKENKDKENELTGNSSQQGIQNSYKPQPLETKLQKLNRFEKKGEAVDSQYHKLNIQMWRLKENMYCLKIKNEKVLMEIQKLKEEENTKRLAEIAQEDDLTESSNIKEVHVCEEVLKAREFQEQPSHHVVQAIDLINLESNCLSEGTYQEEHLESEQSRGKQSRELQEYPEQLLNVSKTIQQQELPSNQQSNSKQPIQQEPIIIKKTKIGLDDQYEEVRLSNSPIEFSAGDDRQDYSDFIDCAAKNWNRNEHRASEESKASIEEKIKVEEEKSLQSLNI